MCLRNLRTPLTWIWIALAAVRSKAGNAMLCQHYQPIATKVMRVGSNTFGDPFTKNKKVQSKGTFVRALFLVCSHFGMCSFQYVLFLACVLIGLCTFGMCSFWYVLILACSHFGMCSFWHVLILAHAHFGMCSFWYVLFVACTLLGITLDLFALNPFKL